MDKTIVLIQPNEEYEEFLENLLIEDGYIVKHFDSEVELLNKLEDIQLDLLISSYNLPNLDTKSFVDKVHKILPELKILFITQERDISTLTNILKSENCDVMVKPIVTEELLARLKVLTTPNAIHLNNKNSDILKIKDLVLNTKTKIVKRAGKDISLTPKEYSLLEYLMFNKNIVLSRDNILSKVWGTVTDVSDRIVDVYIGYLRDKIDTGHKNKLLETVPGFGYRIKD